MRFRINLPPPRRVEVGAADDADLEFRRGATTMALVLLVAFNGILAGLTFAVQPSIGEALFIWVFGSVFTALIWSSRFTMWRE